MMALLLLLPLLGLGAARDQQLVYRSVFFFMHVRDKKVEGVHGGSSNGVVEKPPPSIRCNIEWGGGVWAQWRIRVGWWFPVADLKIGR